MALWGGLGPAEEGRRLGLASWTVTAGKIFLPRPLPFSIWRNRGRARGSRAGTFIFSTISVCLPVGRAEEEGGVRLQRAPSGLEIGSRGLQSGGRGALRT